MLGRRHSEEETWVAAQEPRDRRPNHDVYVANRSSGDMFKGERGIVLQVQVYRLPTSALSH